MRHVLLRFGEVEFVLRHNREQVLPRCTAPDHRAVDGEGEGEVAELPRKHRGFWRKLCRVYARPVRE
jgi:hypothetical protein